MAALAGLAITLFWLSGSNAAISRSAGSELSASREALSRVAVRWRELGAGVDVGNQLPEGTGDHYRWMTEHLLLAQHHLTANAPLVIVAVSVQSFEDDGSAPHALGTQVTIAFLSRDDGADFQVVPLPAGVSRLEHHCGASP